MKKLTLRTAAMLLAFPTVCWGYSGTCPVSQKLDWNVLVFDPLKNMFIEAVRFIPDLLLAIFIILIGWLIAKLAQVIISGFLKSIGFDGFAKMIGVATILEENKENAIAPHKWFGLLAFWVTMIISFVMALNKLRLRIASIHLDNFLQFLMSIFTVVVIFVLGMFLSFVVSKIVKSVAEHTKIQKPELWANITRTAILVFTSIVCLVEIGLPPQIMLIAISGIYISLCIVFVVSFGIGGVGWASKVLDRTLEKKEGHS
ncbi:MAG: hypothetical protein ABII88_08505 [Candidatus Omnitrophota bacterium]